ncbi:hypothetical protein ONZ45_g16272 [Pleurotus djamor]|nr:hypothetical protein ONZ45_g16272 [Pleurotus djamor]
MTRTRVLTNIAAQELDDKELALLEAAIRATKTRRNTHSAISHLPDEILSLIFAQCQAKSRLRIHQVCTHWRRVALNTPQLWTRITLYSNMNRAALDWLELSLQRAKSVPLDVKCHLPFPKWDTDAAFWSNVTQILSPSNRCIRTLDIQADGFDSLVRLFTVNPGPLEYPFLEKLSMRGSGSLVPGSHKFSSLGNWTRLPKLKWLNLDSLPIPAQLPCLSSLTHVNILCDYTPVSSLIRALEQMPAIEVACVFGLAKDSAAPPTLPVVLPNLKKLSVNLRNSGSARCFDSLELPTSASVLVTFSDWAAEGTDLPDICWLSAQLYKSMGPPCIDALNLQLCVVQDTFGIAFLSKEDNGKRQFIFPKNNKVQMTRLNPVFDMFPTEMFTSVTFEVNHYTRFMDVIFHRFAHLKHLRLLMDARSDANLTDALRKLLKSETQCKLRLPPAPSQTPVPQLSLLHSEQCQYA